MAKFEVGNKAAEKWTEEEVHKLFNDMRAKAREDNAILSFQDAILSVDLYSSSTNYLIDKFPVFESIKKDIADIIIARINKNALKGDFNPAASIWRMKQLGEKDTQYQEVKSDVKQTNIISLGKGKKPD
jgi:hypothetical protein